MKLGAQIAMSRRRASLTQRELAEKCGCTITSISEIERGRWFPREPRILLGIAMLLGISAEELLQRVHDERELRPSPGK